MKQKKCSCGKMILTYPGNNVLRIRGGYIFGNGRAFARCFDCPTEIRIGYDIELEDQKGQVFHRVDRDKPGTATPKKKKPKKKKAKDEWEFVDG